MRALHVYGTVFNNANRVERSLKSIERLNPAKIYITDNYSTDGTYEILRRHKKVEVIRAKSNRGEGKQLALERLLEKAAPSDAVIMVDLDTIYKNKYADFITKRMKALKDNVMYTDIGQLATARTLKKLPWLNTNNSEDIERFARAVSFGIKLYKINTGDGLENLYFQNEVDVGGLREARYARNWFAFFPKVFFKMVNMERNEAHKSFRDFRRSFRTQKSPIYVPVIMAAYITAKLMGIRSHNSKLSNTDYVIQNEIKIS